MRCTVFILVVIAAGIARAQTAPALPIPVWTPSPAEVERAQERRALQQKQVSGGFASKSGAPAANSAPPPLSPAPTPTGGTK